MHLLRLFSVRALFGLLLTVAFSLHPAFENGFGG
jgi:hypothetical protein